MSGKGDMRKKKKEKKMELHDGELAYRLLKSANVSDIQQTVVRTSIAKLNIDHVKKQLKVVNDTTISSQRISLPKSTTTVELVYACKGEKEVPVTYCVSGYGRAGRGISRKGQKKPAMEQQTFFQ